MAALKQEIAQQRPFRSLREEALLNLLRTADVCNRAFQQQTRCWPISSTQYNVLRILRGAHPDGLTCTAIGSRMIAAEPDITRLLSRLKAQKLITQRRDVQDKRVVWTRITDAGLALLEEMDPVIDQIPEDLFAPLKKSEVKELIRLLELARSTAS